MSSKIQSAGTFLVNQRTVKALQSFILTGERLQGLAIVAQIRGVTSDHKDCSIGHIYMIYTENLWRFIFQSFIFQSLLPALRCDQKGEQKITDEKLKLCASVCKLPETTQG